MSGLFSYLPDKGSFDIDSENEKTKHNNENEEIETKYLPWTVATEVVGYSMQILHDMS